jgi:hypothetical protein
MLRRSIPIIIAGLVALAIVVSYYFEGLGALSTTTKTLAIKIFAIFFFSGALSLILFHINEIRHKRKLWYYSIVVLATIAVFVGLKQLLPAETALYSEFYSTFYVEVGKGLRLVSFAWALIALYKSYRLTSWNGIWIVVGGAIVLLGAAPYAGLIPGGVEAFRWGNTYLLGNTVKVFDVMGSIGSVLLVLRTLLGLERSFMAVPEAEAGEEQA